MKNKLCIALGSTQAEAKSTLEEIKDAMVQCMICLADTMEIDRDSPLGKALYQAHGLWLEAHSLLSEINEA